MALQVGEVAVEFAANLDQLFKQLEKLGEKIDEVFAGDQTVKVEIDNRVVDQIDRIVEGVEKVSDLADKFKNITEAVFDSLDGRIGNTSEQIEESFGGALKDVDQQSDDFVTKFVDRIVKGVTRLNPLVMGQLFGAVLLIERLVIGGFKLTSILPKFIAQGTGLSKVVGGLLAAIQTLDFGFLLGFVVDLSQSLLSMTTVIGLLTAGLRGITGLALRFLGQRPDTQLQKFVVLLETLNAGLTGMLNRTKIFIERLFFITSGLTALATTVTVITTGVSGLAAVVSPFLALVVTGIAGIRFAAAKINDFLLRLRASAGDGRAQTTLFLRSLRGLFPILDALARNAKPIAKMIQQFAKGGIDKKVKLFTDQLKSMLSSIQRIDQNLRKLQAMVKNSADRVLAQMDEIINKAERLFEQIGRRGARDALESVDRVRGSAKEATADVKSSLVSLVPAVRRTEKSVEGLGARFISMSGTVIKAISRTSAELLATVTGLRAVRNIVEGLFAVVVDMAGTVWPIINSKVVQPAKDFLLFLPRQVNKFANQTVPDAVNRLTARVFKGVVGVRDRVTQFFGLTELTEEQANQKAIEAIQKRSAGLQKQKQELEENLTALRRSAEFGEEEIQRQRRLREVQERLNQARQQATELERRLKGDLTADPEGARKKLAATREEMKKLATEANALDAPFVEVQQRIIEAETQLRGLNKTMSQQFSREAIEKLTKEIQANSRPVRATIARLGIDATTSFASGLKAAKSVVAAALVAPFNAAATKRQIRTAASNLSKSFRAAFSSALRIGGGLLSGAGGLAKMLGFDRLGSVLGGAGRAITGRAGTTAGLTAGTPEEEAAKRQAAAQAKAAKAQEELTEVLRAEKTVSEASIQKEKLAQQAADLQINNQKLMSGQMEKTENVLREMTGSFLQLATAAQKLEETTDNTEVNARKLSKNLRAADFQPAIDMARMIEQSMPSVQDMRAQFERLADAAGLDAKTRERARTQLDNAQNKLEAVLEKRVEAVTKLTGSDSLRVQAAQKELEALEKKAASDQGTVQDQEAVIAQRIKVAKMVQEAETKLIQELKDAENAVNVNSAAFAKYTKEIEEQQRIIDESGAQSKEGRAAQEKLTRAMQNRQQVAAIAEKDLTKRVNEVQEVMLASRNALTQLPNAVKDFAQTFNKISKVEGVNMLTNLAAQEAAGEDLTIFTNKATAALREQVKSIESQQEALSKEEKEARALLSEKKSSAQLQKRLDKALRESTITEEQLAALSDKSVEALRDATSAEQEVADATEIQQKATQQGTGAMKDMSAQARAVAGALEKAKLSIDEGGQSFEELAGAADSLQTEAREAKPKRAGARVGQGQTGQLRDLMAMLMANLSPAQMEKAPLGPIRERLKNAPELKALDQLGGTADELEMVLTVLNKITQKPVERVKKLSDNFNNLLTLLRRLESRPERLEAFTKQFSPETIGNLSRMVGLMDKMVGAVKKIKVEGSAAGRTKTAGFESAALRTLGQLIERGIEGSIDFSTIPKRLLQALRQEFKNVKGIEFGGAGQQAIASELELAVRSAVKQVSGKLSARGEAGVKIAHSIADGMEAGKSAIAKAADKTVEPIADRLPRSLPKAGPLRNALLRLPGLGKLMGQQMLKGAAALTNLSSQFMAQGFEGLLPAAFEAAASVSDTFIKGLGTGLSKIGKAIGKIPLAGLLAEIPLRVAGAVTKALGVVTSGIAKLGAKITSSVTSLVKETSSKLLKLSLDATRLRLDPNNLQRFNEAMGILGGTASDAESGLQQLIQSIEQVARGSAPELERAFADAGLSMADLQRMDTDEIFLRVAQAANQAGGDIRRQSDLLRVIGADFSNLRGIVLQGGEAIADAFERANKNPPIDEKTIELGSKFTGVMSQIEQTIERIKLIVFDELAPILDDALESFGKDSRTQIDFILENVRTAVRIVIRTIQLVANFVRERYIEAQGGASKFFEDLMKVGRIAFSGLGKILEVVLDKGIKLAGAALDAAWNTLEGQTKSSLGGVLIFVGELLGKAGAAIIAFSGSIIRAVSDFGKDWLDDVKVAGLELAAWVLHQVEKVINKISGPLTDAINVVREALGKDPVAEAGADLAASRADLRRRVREINRESARRDLEDEQSFLENFAEIFTDISKKVEDGGDAMQEAFDTMISTNEVQAFLEEVKGVENEAERLRAVINNLNETGVLDFKTTGEESVERLRSALSDFAERGIIPPGAVSEGAEALRREAIEALGDVSTETGEALKEAFRSGFVTLKSEFPEFAKLLQEIGIQGQRELDATAVRLAELKKEQEKLNKRTQENLEIQKKANLSLIEQRRNLEAVRKGFDLRRELQQLTDGFVGPFTEASRKVEELRIAAKEKALELSEFFEESSRTLDLSDQLIQTKLIAEQIGLSTRFATLQISELEAATSDLREAMNALQSAAPEDRAMAQQRVDAARQRLEDVKKMSMSALGGLQGDITNQVADGFEEGIKVAASKPIVDILRDNLVVPVLGAFKDTIKGLVDGTLIEAAREAEQIANDTGQKFSRVLFIIADLGKRIFETAFDNLLETTFNNLTEGLTASIQDAFKDAEGSATGLGDAAGAAIAAAIQAAIALAGLILSRLQGEISATEEAVESIVDSTEAIRGVISGSTTVAIKEAEDAFRDAQKPIVIRLDTIINLMRSAISGANIPSIPLAGAASSSIP